MADLFGTGSAGARQASSVLTSAAGSVAGSSLADGLYPVTRLDEQIVKQSLEQQDYSELDVTFDGQERILWYSMAPRERPSFTVGLMQDIRKLQESVRTVFVRSPDTMGPPVRYMVLTSSVPRIFNLGGDLGLFSQLIRQRNRRALKGYSRLAIGAVHANAVNLNLSLITISLVEGDALGGGFEAAMSSNVLVAERGVKFGLPEILFNLFPGMGAYPLLTRKIDPATAEKMIFSGRLYDAEEMYELGVVDVLAERGAGRQAIYDYVAKNGRFHSAHQAIYKVRQRINGIDYAELADISDIWVEAALSLSEADLNRMDRLARAQDRRWSKIRDKSTPKNVINLASGD